MKIVFERTQRVIIETADDSLENHTEFAWSDWANNAGNAMHKNSILTRQFDGDLPNDRVIETDHGSWRAVSADPDFVKPERRKRA